MAFADSDVALIEYPIPLNPTASCTGVMSTISPGACFIVEAIDPLHDRL